MTQSQRNGSINADIRWIAADEANEQVWGTTAAELFSCVGWARAAWKHLPELGQPLVLAVHLGPDTWWLPLSERGREVRLAGAPLGDRQDLVGPAGPGRPVAAAAMLSALAGRSDDIWLHALAPGSQLAIALHGFPEWTVEPEPAPYIPTTVAAPPSALRRLRRLERLGPTRIEVRRHPQLDEVGVRSFTDARRAAWRARARASPWVERLPGFAGFLCRAVTDLAGEGRARLWELHVAEEIVAQDLHLGPPEAPLLYMRAYDPAWAALSPGQILLEQTLLLLRQQGVDVLDSGRGDEPYKLALGGDASTVVNAVLRRSRQILR